MNNNILWFVVIILILSVLGVFIYLIDFTVDCDGIVMRSVFGGGLYCIPEGYYER